VGGNKPLGNLSDEITIDQPGIVENDSFPKISPTPKEVRHLRVGITIDRLGVVENNSIPIISATAKAAGHEVILVEFDADPQKAISRLKDFKPDVLAYSVMSPEANRYIEINDILKKEVGGYSIFGGVHPTFFQQYIENDGVDAICVGEGDIAFRDFLNNFGTDEMFETTNMHFKLDDGSIKKNGISKLIEDIDSLPMPDKGIVYEESYGLRHLPIRNFFATRGCPYKCTYCFNHAFNEMYRGKGSIVRMKTVPYMIEEIKSTLREYPAQFLKFQDDVFGIKKDWMDEFAEVYPKEIGLPYVALVRPNMVNEHYARNLKKSGCHAVAIAIESGNDEIRNNVMERSMKSEQISDAFDLLRDNGIKTYCYSMLGLPGETLANFKETLHLNQELDVDYASASIFQPYPGIKMTKYALDNGFLDEEQQSWGGQFSESVLNFPQNLKDTLHTYHVMFPLLVEYPWLERWIGQLEATYKTGPGKSLMNIILRLSYGWMLWRRIYPVSVPFRLLAWNAYTLIFSRHRN